MPDCRRIIYILNARWPTSKAYGLQVAKMCEAFVETGVGVTLVVPRRKSHPQVNEQNYRESYALRKRLSVVYLFSFDWIVFGFLGKVLFALQELLFAFRARLFVIGMEGVVYTRDLYTASLFIFTKRPVVLELHNAPRRWSLWQRYILHRLPKIVVISQALAERIRELKIPDTRIMLSPDGYDDRQYQILPSRMEARYRVHLPEEMPIVLYAGHLFAWKGVDILAHAAPMIDGLVVFVGGTESDITRMKMRYGMIPNILFIGHRPHSEIPLWLRAADVLILPNRGEEDISRLYTSPLKMFEYMASGTPIVASDLPSIREVLSEKSAILVTPDDPQALARAIQRVVTEPQLASRISECAGELIRNYAWEHRAEKIIRHIQCVIG